MPDILWQKSLAGRRPAPQARKSLTANSGAGLRPAIFGTERLPPQAFCNRSFTVAVQFVALSLSLLAAEKQPAKDQPVKEQPVGLVLSPNGSKLLRADTETSLAARPGDLLFAGDGLRTEAGAASFLFCPGKAIETLGPSGEVRLDAKQPKVKSGKISEQPARACTLPSA